MSLTKKIVALCMSTFFVTFTCCADIHTVDGYEVLDAEYIRMFPPAYINWGSWYGETGYGFRSNAGDIEYKNLGGSWSAFSALTNFWQRAGTVLSPANAGDTIESDSAEFNTLSAHDTTLYNTVIVGGQKSNVTTVNSATYDLLVTDYILNVTYTATAAVTSLTLPTVQCVDGRIVIIKDSGGSASVHNITIDTEGAEKIDGVDTAVLSGDYEAIIMYSDGSNWFIY